MLKISRKVEYALIALRHLQGLKKEELASAKELADSYGVPKELLAKVLQRLAKKNIVDANIGYKFSQKVSIDVDLQNLTNDRYFTYAPLPEIGFQTMATLTYKF